MLQLHIDINDHLIILNVPNSKYAKSLLLRQNWSFERAWLYIIPGMKCVCVYYLNELGILCQKNFRRFYDK